MSGDTIEYRLQGGLPGKGKYPNFFNLDLIKDNFTVFRVISHGENRIATGEYKMIKGGDCQKLNQTRQTDKTRNDGRRELKHCV